MLSPRGPPLRCGPEVQGQRDARGLCACPGSGLSAWEPLRKWPGRGARCSAQASGAQPWLLTSHCGSQHLGPASPWPTSLLRRPAPPQLRRTGLSELMADRAWILSAKLAMRQDELRLVPTLGSRATPISGRSRWSRLEGSCFCGAAALHQALSESAFSSATAKF